MTEHDDGAGRLDGAVPRVGSGAVMIEYFNEDCMIGMARYPDKHFDLAIVDPPYGGNDAIGLSDNKDCKKQATQRTEYKTFDNVAPDEKYFEELKRDVYKRQGQASAVNFTGNSRKFLLLLCQRHPLKDTIIPTSNAVLLVI